MQNEPPESNQSIPPDRFEIRLTQSMERVSEVLEVFKGFSASGPETILHFTDRILPISEFCQLPEY